MEIIQENKKWNRLYQYIYIIASEYRIFKRLVAEVFYIACVEHTQTN